MTLHEFFCHRAMIMLHIKKERLRGMIAIPTAVQLSKAAFLACSCTWQEKYTESHEEISANQQPGDSATRVTK
jgi:hypothetical protein